MSRQKKPHNETPNALKHGAYSVIAILPGEDARALDELLSRLIEEWKPSGPTEYDAVATIARCMWRKKRLQRYLLGSMDARQLDPESRAFDVKFALTAALSLLETEPECVPKALGVCPIWIREKIY